MNQSNELTVLSERVDRTLYVRLNRPEKRNAMNSRMISELRELASRISENSEISLVVLKSFEGPFCAGADLHYMQSFSKMNFKENQMEAESLFDLFESWSKLPVPILCLAQGAAIGGGLGLLACADLVILAEDTRLQFSEVRLGLIPATIAPFVLRKANRGWLRAMMLSGEAFTAEEAKENGLVYEVCKVHEMDHRERYWTEAFLRNSGPAMRELKDLMQRLEPTSTAVHRNQTAKAIAEARVRPDSLERLEKFFGGTR